MKNYLFLLASILAFSSCSVNNNSSTADKTDSSAVQESDTTSQKGLVTKMEIQDSIKVGGPLEMKFTVYNLADTAQTFCKWHTPFEPLMSKYLDVKDENGTEVDYRGAMAKRIMPPPADSYISIKPGDSLVSTVDLLKGYSITKPSKYSITYVGGNMSGLVVKDSVTFVYQK